ncbi:MAG: hypothetical protein JNL05_03310, partial [Flavobacteriales bacterium]|nr:hypothetical protein [Flavobacteriales bacterium]
MRTLRNMWSALLKAAACSALIAPALVHGQTAPLVNIGLFPTAVPDSFEVRVYSDAAISGTQGLLNITFTIRWNDGVGGDVDVNSISGDCIRYALTDNGDGTIVSPSPNGVGFRYFTFNVNGLTALGTTCPITTTPQPIGGFKMIGLTGCAQVNIVNDAYTSQTVPVQINKSYYLSLGGTNRTGTIYSTPLQVGAAQAPTPGSYGPLCSNGSPIVLGGSPAGGTWTGTGVTGSGPYSFNPSAGTQTLTYSVTTNGCSSSAQTTVTVNPAPSTPTISAGGPTTFCAGGSVTLTSSSATGNVWSPGGQTTQSITVSTGGTYSVTVTSNGCSATSAGTTVTVNPAPSTPTISAGGPTTFCAGGSVTLTSSSATGNVWSPGGQTTQSITVSAGGTYSVT